MLLNFVRRPGIEPATTGLSLRKVLTHLTKWFRETFDGIYSKMVMSAEN